MKAKSLLSLILLLVIVGSLWFFLKKNGDNKIDENSGIGTYLFANLPIDSMSSVFMQDGLNSVTLIKKDNSWIVAEKGYRADIDKMRNTVSELRDAKIWKVIKATDEIRSRLNLINPSSTEQPNDNKATRLVVRKENEDIMADMLVGSFRTSPEGRKEGGRYIIKNGLPEIINIDVSLAFIDALPQSWLNTKLIDIKSNMIKKISAFNIDGMGNFSFGRSGEEVGFDPIIFPEGEEPDNDKLTRVAESLENLNFIDVLPISDIDVSPENYLNFELNDGTAFNIYPMIADGKKFIKIELFPNELNEKETSDEAINGIELQKHFAQWMFILSTWEYEAFITRAENLILEEKI